jgi:hypothetical protein
MCFYNDYDWSAEIYDQLDPVATEDLHCQECNREIKTGQQHHYIFMQESETCRHCDNLDLECCECEEPNFGEQDEYWCCTDCWQFRGAVKEAEKDEGCPPGERSPSLQGMLEEISQFDGDEPQIYFAKAEAMHPHLKESGYLAWLWSKMFHDRPYMAKWNWESED